MRKYKQGPPKEIICPHPDCFEPFPLWNLRFKSGDKTYPPERPFLARWRGIPPRYAVGPNGERLRAKVCPRHEHPLPYTAGEQEDLIIGLIGAKQTGKSHYVGTLLERLEGQVGTAFNGALLNIDEATVARRRMEFQDPLRRRLELNVTDPLAPPLLYNLTLSAPGNHGNIRSATLALCDTAGENLYSQDNIIERTKYLPCAAGLIFVIDLLQTEAVRQAVPSSVRLPLPDPQAAPNEILGRVVQELTKRGLVGGKRTAKLTTPVAVAVTKCDALREAGLIDAQSLWNQDVHHEGYYDLTLHDDVNGMFSEFVKQWSQAAWNIINASFENVAFFGVSATGCSSDKNHQYARIAPWRVEDPLLWLLYQLGVIPGRRND
ncbi:MAG: hypothetical protein HYZ50_20245 [Deltaproteobacteria bacterium]|nr:hypothetical protein [Deltaproteobacteria bacterium]